MNQDLLIIIGATSLASALLIVGFTWEVRRSRRPLRVRPPKPGPEAAAARPPVPSAATTTTAPSSKHRGPFAVIRDLIDASIAMYAIRGLLGWDTTPRSQRSTQPLAYLDEDVVASRIGAVTGPVVRRPTRLVVAGSPVEPAPVAAAAAAPGPDRRRLLRDSLAAAAVVVAILFFAVTIWPRSFQGDVQDETGTPAPSATAVIDATASPSDTPTPTPDPTGSPTPEGFANVSVAVTRDPTSPIVVVLR